MSISFIAQFDLVLAIGSFFRLVLMLLCHASLSGVNEVCPTGQMYLLLSNIANKDLLEHSQTHSFPISYCCWIFAPDEFSFFNYEL